MIKLEEVKSIAKEHMSENETLWTILEGKDFYWCSFIDKDLLKETEGEIIGEEINGLKIEKETKEVKDVKILDLNFEPELSKEEKEDLIEAELVYAAPEDKERSEEVEGNSTEDGTENDTEKDPDIEHLFGM